MHFRLQRPARPRCLSPRSPCCPRRRPLRQSGEVNVYTTREPGLIQPLLDAFTKETGIKVNAIFVESGLAERVEAEGANSPADVDLGGRLRQPDRSRRPRPDAADRVGGARRGGAGRTCATRTGNWYALSMRARVIYASKDRVERDGAHLRGSRRSEVEGPRLHPLRPAPLQHLALRRDDRQGRRREDRDSS